MPLSVLHAAQLHGHEGEHVKVIMKPKVSIVLPIYNVERFLRQCLASVTEQTLSEIEIVCVDDGSTDGSPSIIDEFAAQDTRIIAIHKENEGYGKAVNMGIAHATGQYIGIVEPDDYIDQHMYETLFSAADHNAFPDIVKGAYWRVCNADTPNEQILPANYLHAVKEVDKPFELASDAELLFHHPSIWSAIYRAGFLSDRGIKMPEIPGAGWADNPFLIETLISAKSIVFVDEPLYYYREFNVGSSSNVKDPSIIFNRWLDMDRIIKQHHVTSPRILEGHYNRGCAYIEMLDEDFSSKDPTVKEGISRMVKHIDYNAVFSSEKIPQHYKDAYQRHVPLATRLISKAKRLL